jgi:hypothetical protein
MKRVFFILLTFSFINVYSQHPEKYFKFVEPNKEIINTKITTLVSIDKVIKDTVWAYANQEEFEKFTKLGYKVEDLTSPSFLSAKVLNMATDISQMANWNRYPTYTVYRNMMKKFEADYPTLCKLDSIGTTVNGRKLYVVKISDNVNEDEAEPEFFYTSTIHGDETTGYLLMLRLIDYLLSQYNIDPRIKSIVDNMAIYINPNANPDGTYYAGNNTVSGSTRYNANDVDLNRNFPDPRVGNHPDGYSWQPETEAMMTFADLHHFNGAANFHGGIELANFPWDTWESIENKHADHNWYYTVSRAYADTVHKYSPSDYFTGMDNGVTHGGDWYVVAGGRQDYMNYWHHCREITFEISDTKLLSTDLLPSYWDYNKKSLLNLLDNMYSGFLGRVTNSLGEPLLAKITILNHDKDSSEVYTNPNTGDYYRPIEPGTYSIKYSATGYPDLIKENTVISDAGNTVINVVLDGGIINQDVNGSILNNKDNQPISNATITLSSNDFSVQTTTNSIGEFSLNNIPTGITKFDVSAEGFYSTTRFENHNTTSNSFTIKLIEQQIINGIVIDSATNNPISNVAISLLDENISTTTDNNGQFQIENLLAKPYKLKLQKTDYLTKTVDITPPITEPLQIKLINGSSGTHDINKDLGFLNIFPNPFTESINIAFHLEQPDFVEITLYTIEGKLILKTPKTNYNSGDVKVTLPTSTMSTSLKAGNYIVKVSTSKKNYSRIVQHLP